MIKILTEKYKIYWIIISFYNSQVNEIIEVSHKSIANALSKLMMREILTEMNEWVTHFFAVLWADWMIVKKSTRMTLFWIFHEKKTMFFIKLDVLMWQMLSWKMIWNIDDLMMMQARQIEKCDTDIEKVKTHLQHMQIQDKKQYDKIKKLITKFLKKNNLVLLHNNKLKMSYSVKLKFCWTESYCIQEVIEKKKTYFLEKLDEALIKKHFHENQVKKFWTHNKLMYVFIEKKNENNDEAECLNQEEQQNNKNKAWWISSE